MEYVKADRPGPASIIAAVLGAALIGTALLSPATNVAQAQTEPATAANGVLLPPLDFDPVAARNEDLAESAVVPASPTPPVDTAEASTAASAPDAVTDAPEAVSDDPETTGAPDSESAMTTSLGGEDVAVSSVGGSYEVDRPRKRSERRN